MNMRIRIFVSICICYIYICVCTCTCIYTCINIRLYRYVHISVCVGLCSSCKLRMQEKCLLLLVCIARTRIGASGSCARQRTAVSCLWWSHKASAALESEERFCTQRWICKKSSSQEPSASIFNLHAAGGVSKLGKGIRGRAATNERARACRCTSG